MRSCYNTKFKKDIQKTNRISGVPYRVDTNKSDEWSEIQNFGVKNSFSYYYSIFFENQNINIKYTLN